MEGWLNVCKSMTAIHHKKIKNKNQMIMSLDAEQGINKNLTSLYVF